MNLDETALARLSTWLNQMGLAGLAEAELVGAYCARIEQLGVPLTQGTVLIDTLHPIHEGRAFRWTTGATRAEEFEYGRTREGPAADAWKRSPLYHMVETNQSRLRRRLFEPPPENTPDFAAFEALRQEGKTDYLALVLRFGSDGVIGDMDAIYSVWTSVSPAGFDDGDIAVLERLMVPLAAALKCVSLARIASTLVETYLGRDAGRRVLNGRIERGIAERIGAVLWYSDLRGYTRITDTAAPEQIIPLLNDYADVVISSIHTAGGDVLKLIGDGTLAIFRDNDASRGCGAALSTAIAMRRGVNELNARRAAAGQPITEVYLGLHVGEVFYGNIGSFERLDFTVVGPAVNEVSRIAAMCRSAERDVLVSASFAATANEADRRRLVSVGRFALRGLAQAQELYTLDQV